MISSMTGYGRGEANNGSLKSVTEIRSVNNRFLEINLRIPRSLNYRENDIKEIIRRELTRGKINVSITLERQNGMEPTLKINRTAVKSYYKLLVDLKRTLKLQSRISLSNILAFPDVFEPTENYTESNDEWNIVEKSLRNAIQELNNMRLSEGNELKKDFTKRLKYISTIVNEIEEISKMQIPKERSRLRERINQMLDDSSIVDQNRLELELALLADKLDVTEECTRLRSHNKYFLAAFNDKEPMGRKLTFLLQEMNREVNTIGAKSNDTEISHRVISIKEELEKIREQLQNIE